MKLIFAGTPEFAAQSLRALADAGHEIALVLTQPDRPAGRGMALQASPVKQLAVANGWRVFQPQTLRDAVAQAEIAAVGAEVMVVAAYGLILPQTVLDMPSLGCLNIHASLLPRWRGAAPIQRAILAGDAESGVCIMQMAAGLDTGPVLSSASLPLAQAETAQTLHDRLAELGARLIVEALPQLPLPAVPQPDEGVTYAHKLEKAEAVLDWRLSAVELDRRVRAFNPFPVAQSKLDGLAIKIWKSEPVALPAGKLPGTLVDVAKSGIVVACGEGGLRITELQKAGGKRLPVAQFLAGNTLQPGQAFALPEA